MSAQNNDQGSFKGENSSYSHFSLEWKDLALHGTLTRILRSISPDRWGYINLRMKGYSGYCPNRLKIKLQEDPSDCN